MNHSDELNRFPAIVEVTIAGCLSADWKDWLGGLVMWQEGNTTKLFGEIADQPAFYGLILKLRDLGLSLISIKVVN